MHIEMTPRARRPRRETEGQATIRSRKSTSSDAMHGLRIKQAGSAAKLVLAGMDNLYWTRRVAPRVGCEPVTHWLTAGCRLAQQQGRLISASGSLGWGSSDRAKERLKSLRRDPDRVRDAHVVQFAALAEAVHRGRGHAEPCSHLFDREKRADPNRASHRCPDHGRTQILGKRR